jgi:chemotaxis signal transduction protein
MTARKKGRTPRISYRELLGDAAAPPAPVPTAPDAEAPRAAEPEPAPPPAPVDTRRATPIALAAVLNAPARPTPGAMAVVPERPSGPLSSAALRASGAREVAERPRAPRRATRATVAGRVIPESAVRLDLAVQGRATLLRFRVGPERFALRLADVEEAVEAPVLHPLPDLPRHVLGVCALRGQLVPVHAPAHVLGVPVGSPGVALVLAGAPALALAADDVEDAFTITPDALRDAPGTEDPDGVLLGVTRHAGKLVAVLDAPALAAACLAPAQPLPR